MSTEPETTATPLPPVVRAAWVNRPVDEAFSVFTDEIGAWWPLPTHGLFGERAGSVAFRDDQLIEQGVDGREVIWGEVLSWEPPARVVIAWHPGRDSSEASEVEISFAPHGAGTRVVVEHRGWEIFGAEATSRRRGYVGPGAWGYVLDHYADGAEIRPDAVDVTGLTAAYGEFFAEAERGGFGQPADGEWNAEQVVAHVALNDAAMLNVCQALVHKNPLRFENEICQDRNVLGEWIEEAGDLAGLIERGRAMSRLVLAALARLSPEQHETEVHCRLTHDGQVMADGPIAWGSIAVDTQAAMHLPAHIEQLRDLRPT